MNKIMTEPDFILPASITVIDQEAFMGTNPCYVYIKSGKNEISIMKNAFSGINSLQYVYIPENVISIDDHAFDETNCTIITPEGSYADSWAERNHFVVRHSAP